MSVVEAGSSLSPEWLLIMKNEHKEVPPCHRRAGILLRNDKKFVQPSAVWIGFRFQKRCSMRWLERSDVTSDELPLALILFTPFILNGLN